ncbi:MAG: hypothetical protein ACLPX7_09395 [Xanthobacteraceae bacterium]
MVDLRHRLSKEESRARWRQLRVLWNEYDPIGVVRKSDIGSDQEYESYIGDVLRLLEHEATQEEMVTYLRALVSGHIGLTWSPELAAQTETFAARSRDWYRTKWPGSRV